MQQNETPLIRDLRKYYGREKILSIPIPFRCPHFPECSDGMAVTQAGAADALNSFTPAKSAFVGERYEGAGEWGIPRLLFVSSDPGSVTYKNGPNYTAPENRTPASVRRLRSITSAEEVKPYRKHWRATHVLACKIFQKFGQDISPLQNATPYFAHANAAKCCTNKPKKKETKRTLFKNCRKYLRGEIEVLAPDIIVTQGTKAGRGVRFSFRDSEMEKVCLRAWIFSLKSGKRVFWWETHHASSYGGPKLKRQLEGADGGPGLDGYANLIRDFISNRDPIPR